MEILFVNVCKVKYSMKCCKLSENYEYGKLDENENFIRRGDEGNKNCLKIVHKIKIDLLK